METKGSVQEKESFFKRKDIEISVKRYLQDALSAMALGLFASLLIGVIFNTIGEQTANLFGENMVSSFFVEVGGIAQQYMARPSAWLWHGASRRRRWCCSPVS